MDENDGMENEPREFNIKKRDLPYENWERLYGTNVNHLEMYLIHMSITKMLMVIFIAIPFRYYNILYFFNIPRFSSFLKLCILFLAPMTD